MITKNDFLRVNSDVYGNPRYVLHFLHLADSYEGALAIAKKLGGKKYRAKHYGGGIVFQSYNINTLALDLNKAITFE